MPRIWTARRTTYNKYVISNLWDIFFNGNQVARAFFVYDKLYLHKLKVKGVDYSIPRIEAAIRKIEEHHEVYKNGRTHDYNNGKASASLD